MLPVTTFIMLMALLLGCTTQPAQPEALQKVILLDVQGLEGGRDLWIAANGEAVARLVRPATGNETGLQEERYHFTLSAEQQTQLNSLIQQHQFFALNLKDRYGIPDEARPTIYIQSTKQTHAVGKWAGDQHPDFDPIYHYLRDLTLSQMAEPAVYQGNFHWAWKPDGFPESSTILEMTYPQVAE